MIKRRNVVKGFLLQPETAHSGLADEWNPDNDLDGLNDGDEIVAGSGLYKSDTDDDGLGDYARGQNIRKLPSRG